MKKITLLSISIGIIYVWFGALKFFPDLSPAVSLAGKTIDFLTFGLVKQDIGNFILAIIEVLIGAGLIFQKYKRIMIPAAIIHMLFTFTPLLFFPELSFTKAPFGFTIEGQYIMKNIVIIMALITLLPANQINEKTKH